jgi:SH3 domain protein
MLIRILLILALAMPLALKAEDTKAYVGNEVGATLKNGFGRKARVIQQLDPGTEITVIEKHTRTGNAKVRLSSGEIGWLATRFISDLAPVNTAATTNTAATSAAPEAVVTPEVKPPSAEQLQAEVERLRSELSAVRQVSNNALQIQAERDQLQESLISIKQELEAVNREKNSMNADQKQAWFVIGSLVLLGGILVGVILPRLTVRRKNDWGSF